jgi:IMP dehydrogenase
LKPINLALSYNDVLLVPHYSSLLSRSEVDLATQIAPDIKLDIPLISINMDSVTGVDMAIEMSKLGGMGFMPRFDRAEKQAKDIERVTKKGQKTVACIGVKNGTIERAEMLLKAGSAGLSIDIAHAHTSATLETIKLLKNHFPKVSLIVGTIATYEGAYDLFNVGADTVRVGVGAGTICTTRIVAGSGVPQVTAIMDAVRAKNKFKNKFVLADGGAANSGDVVKGLACGASAVIAGSLFAGTREAPGKIIKKGGALYKEYNGSTSKTEKIKQVVKDKSGKTEHYILHVEGVEAMVPYKGPVRAIVEDICAGVRSGFTYSGAKNIKELWEKAQFVQITTAGYRESTAHDVILQSIDTN